jgi:negative regulator of flagellin synthesis FlgM
MRVSNTTSSPVQGADTPNVKSKEGKEVRDAKDTKDTKEIKDSKDVKKPDRLTQSEAQAKIKSNENTEISPKSKEFAHAKAVAAEAPDIREDRVEELKKKIASDLYRIDERAIADKLVDEHLKMPGMD